MKTGLTLLSGLGLGAGLMYLLDPEMGKRRRAIARDKAIRLTHESADAAEAIAQDFSHRLGGLMAEGRSLFHRTPVPDDVLVERVRSKLGRFVSHPSSIEVSARNGCVTLRGPILAHELDELLACVARVPGVKEIDNQLEVHKQAGDVPGLQGGRGRPGERLELWQRNWSPTLRFLAGALGGGLLVNGVARRTLPAVLFGGVGLALFLRGLTNIEMRRLFGLGRGRRAIDFQKTITINAPVDKVFQFWTNYENFPRFMANVREVQDRGDGHSHWIVAGPAGVSVEWDAVVTRFVPNEVLAWKSEPGSIIANAGILRFQPEGPNRTRVDIRLSYNPPGGALGHALATLLGASPKWIMDEDLLRLKSLLEVGKTSGQEGQVTQEQLAGVR